MEINPGWYFFRIKFNNDDGLGIEYFQRLCTTRKELLDAQEELRKYIKTTFIGKDITMTYKFDREATKDIEWTTI